MNAKSLNTFIMASAMLLLATISSQGQSAYSNAVVALNPAGYWPMHEVEAAAPGDIETNYGTLGLLGTGYWPDWASVGNFHRGYRSGIVGDPSTAVYFPGNNSTYTNSLYLPHASSLTTLNPPFTVECWYWPTNQGSDDIWSQNGFEGLNAGAIGGGNGAVCGVRAYAGDAGMQIYTYYNSSALEGPSGSSPAYPFKGTWCHIVLTCDANTNMTLWTNGIQVGSLVNNSVVGKYSPDYWSPFEVGNGRGNSRPGAGVLDDVAIYTNVLGDVSAHYTAGLSGIAPGLPGSYFSTVTNDNPVVYFRMNSSAYTPPSVASWPTLNNYGSVAVNGVYTPGTFPGILAGNSFPRFPLGLAGTPTMALLGGISSFADAGNSSFYNPTGSNAVFSVLAMFRGNPCDNRVQSIVGHGTNSWELDVNTTGNLVFNAGNAMPSSSYLTGAASGSAPGDIQTLGVYNDGNWHQVLVVNQTNQVSIYVDGTLDTSGIPSGIATTNIISGNAGDVMIGSDPSWTNNPAGPGRSFAGEICDVAFFNSALTAAQDKTLASDAEMAPSISLQPVSAVVYYDQYNYTNLVIAGGSPPLSCQWYTNGVAVGGETNASLIFNPVTPANVGTNYYLVVTNAYGAVTSSVVSVAVLAAPVYTAQYPMTCTNSGNTNFMTLYGGNLAAFGSTPTFSVSWTGEPPYYYQWYTNGVPVGWASGVTANGVNTTNVSMTLTNCQIGGPTTIYCVVTNLITVLNSNPATSEVWQVTYLPTPTTPFPQLMLGYATTNPLVGYWRLNEPDSGNQTNNGVICHDYASGNNGFYTNTTLSVPGYSGQDPGETAAFFANPTNQYYIQNSFVSGIGSNVDFSAGPNTNSEVTVMVWANGENLPQISQAALVGKGWYNPGEQFYLDEGAAGNDVRLFIRQATQTAHNDNSTFNLGADSHWHFIVGVIDEAGTNEQLWIDGVQVVRNYLTSGIGLQNYEAPAPFLIGSRDGSAVNSYANMTYQFQGELNEAAVFKYPLSSNQIEALWLGGAGAPTIVQQPISTNIDAGATLRLPAIAAGSVPLHYMWFDVNANSYIAGQTNATLVISNDMASDSYYLTVTNVLGSTNSTTASVNVISGLPQINSGPQNPFYAAAGGTANNSVIAYGSLPLAYQWQYSNTLGWVNISGSRFSGTQTGALNILSVYPSDAGFYQLVITNIYGAITSSPAELFVSGVPVTFNGGSYWTANPANAPAQYVGGLLTLSAANGSLGTSSYFFQIPQYVGAFYASFTYEANYGGSQPYADGTTFCIQNDPRGASAVGLGGGDLAVDGSTPANPPVSGNTITPSIELELNIYPGATGGMGYSINSDGGIGPNTAPGSIVLTNVPVDVSLSYANGQLSVTFSNEVLGYTYSTSANVNIPQVLGTNAAYVGFTGSSGGDYSVQTITNFTFVSIPEASIRLLNPGMNSAVSWPGNIFGYALQQNSSVTTNNWQNVTNQVLITNGQNEVIMPQNGNSQFYRLMFQQ